MGIFDWLTGRKENKLEELLSGLSTKEAKAEAVYMLGYRGRNMPLPLIEQAIEFYKKAEDDTNRYRAIMIAERAAFPKLRLLELHQELGYYDSAARLAGEEGQPELAAKLYEQAINHHEQKGHFNMAGSIAEMLEQKERALEFYERALSQCEKDEDFFYAGRIARTLGYHDRAKKFFGQAIEQCERRGDFHDAAEAAEGAGQLERAKVYKALDELIFPK